MLKEDLHILVVEDNPGDYFLVKEYLEESFLHATIHHTDSIEKATAFLTSVSPDIILLDLTLPDGMGIETFHAIHKAAPHIPVIILTGLGDKQIALESVKFGAQDYIVKDDCNAAILAAFLLPLL